MKSLHNTNNDTNNNEIEIINTLMNEQLYCKNNLTISILNKTNFFLEKDLKHFQKEDLFLQLSEIELNYLIAVITNKIVYLEKSLTKHNELKQNQLIISPILVDVDYFDKEIKKYKQLLYFTIRYSIIENSKTKNYKTGILKTKEILYEKFSKYSSNKRYSTHS